MALWTQTHVSGLRSMMTSTSATRTLVPATKNAESIECATVRMHPLENTSQSSALQPTVTDSGRSTEKACSGRREMIPQCIGGRTHLEPSRDGCELERGHLLERRLDAARTSSGGNGRNTSHNHVSRRRVIMAAAAVVVPAVTM